MKLWAAAATLALAAAAAGAGACQLDEQCPTDFFCSLKLSECVACVRCADYSRRDVVDCAKTADDCGDCLPGFAASHQSHECVDAAVAAAEAEADAHRPLPYYVWVPMLIGTLVALLALGVACAPRLKRSKLFRPAPYSPPGDAEVPRCSSPSPQQPPPPESSAPPPPYNDALNNNYSPSFPFTPTDRSARKPDYAEEAEIFPSGGAHRPKFVERSDSVHVNGHRETETGQEARVYNNPNYITAPQVPPSYDDAVSETSDSNGPPGVEESEETMASTWSHVTEPAHPREEQSLSALLSEARGRELVRQPERDTSEPAAKLLCVRPDERLRSAGDTGDATDAPSTSGAAPSSASAASASAAGAANSNVTFTINFQQLNDVKMLRL